MFGVELAEVQNPYFVTAPGGIRYLGPFPAPPAALCYAQAKDFLMDYQGCSPAQFNSALLPGEYVYPALYPTHRTALGNLPSSPTSVLAQSSYATDVAMPGQNNYNLVFTDNTGKVLNSLVYNQPRQPPQTLPLPKLWTGTNYDGYISLTSVPDQAWTFLLCANGQEQNCQGLLQYKNIFSVSTPYGVPDLTNFNTTFYQSSIGGLLRVQGVIIH